jgi:hypothetical protein
LLSPAGALAGLSAPILTPGPAMNRLDLDSVDQILWMASLCRLQPDFGYVRNCRLGSLGSSKAALVPARDRAAPDRPMPHEPKRGGRSSEA